jgi:hypothetical protein
LAIIYEIRSLQWEPEFYLEIFVCSQSGDHPHEDVEKVAILLRKILVAFGYKLDLKYKALIILLYFY